MRVIKYNVSIIKIRSCFLICKPLFNSNLQLNLPSWRRPFHPDFNLLMEENGVGWHSGEEGPWPGLLVLVGITLQLNTKYYALYRNIIMYRILYIVIYSILNLIYWMAIWALGWKDLDQALWCLWWGNYSVRCTHHATSNTIKCLKWGHALKRNTQWIWLTDWLILSVEMMHYQRKPIRGCLSKASLL